MKIFSTVSTTHANEWFLHKAFAKYCHIAIIALSILCVMGLAKGETISEWSGNPKAKVSMTMIVSLTCPHCGDFHRETWPQIKQNYVDKGLVRVRTLLFDGDSIALAGHILILCDAETEVQLARQEFTLSKQAFWLLDKDPIAALKRLLIQTGLTTEQSNRCLNDKATFDKLTLERKQINVTFPIEGTPSFYINNQRHEGFMTYDEFSKLLDSALDKAQVVSHTAL